MFARASKSLADSLTLNERATGLIYPRIERIREVSARVAVGVMRAAVEEVRSHTVPGLTLPSLAYCSRVSIASQGFVD